jgi:hypothetical protein
LLGARCGGTDFVPYDGDPVPPLPVPAQLAPIPDWVPASMRGNRPGGADGVLATGAAWVVPPPPGRPGIVAVTFSNRMAQAVLAPRTGSPFAEGKGGMLCFAVGAGGGWTALDGFPRREVFGPDEQLLAAGVTFRRSFRLPPGLLAGAAGSEGLALAYAARQEADDLVYWAACPPLPVPPVAPEPGTAGTNEWRSLAAYWATNAIPYGPAGVQDVLRDYPEFAAFFPGVVLDTALPEAFRIEFAERMPIVDAWDPGVLAAVTNAPDKDAPLVLAMLNVLQRSGGPSPEELAARRAVNQTLYAMSQDAQLPLLFRLHAAHMFRVGTPYQDFMARTEPHFKLLAADDFRQAAGRFFPTTMRGELRTALTAMSTDTTPFAAGPLAGKYPVNATVGQVASIILADLEAKWAAEPPRQE